MERKKVCKKCSAEYNADFKHCPWCGEENIFSPQEEVKRLDKRIDILDAKLEEISIKTDPTLVKKSNKVEPGHKVRRRGIRRMSKKEYLSKLQEVAKIVNNEGKRIKPAFERVFKDTRCVGGTDYDMIRKMVKKLHRKAKSPDDKRVKRGKIVGRFLSKFIGEGMDRKSAMSIANQKANEVIKDNEQQV